MKQNKFNEQYKLDKKKLKKSLSTISPNDVMFGESIPDYSEIVKLSKENAHLSKEYIFEDLKLMGFGKDEIEEIKKISNNVDLQPSQKSKNISVITQRHFDHVLPYILGSEGYGFYPSLMKMIAEKKDDLVSAGKNDEKLKKVITDYFGQVEHKQSLLSTKQLLLHEMKKELKVLRYTSTLADQEKIGKGLEAAYIGTNLRFINLINEMKDETLMIDNIANSLLVDKRDVFFDIMDKAYKSDETLKEHIKSAFSEYDSKAQSLNNQLVLNDLYKISEKLSEKMSKTEGKVKHFFAYKPSHDKEGMHVLLQGINDLISSVREEKESPILTKLDPLLKITETLLSDKRVDKTSISLLRKVEEQLKHDIKLLTLVSQDMKVKKN